MIHYLDRRHTDCSKWDNLGAMFGSDNLQAMWVADMDFRCPDCVIEALRAYTDFGLFGYYKPRDSYLQAFLDWEETHHSYRVQRDWVRFAPGVVPAVNWLLQILTEPGDAVIVQTPVYYPFLDAVRNNGRTLVCSDLIDTDGVYTVDFEDFERKITEHGVKLFILSSPHNPVGRVWTADELQQILDSSQVTKLEDLVPAIRSLGVIGARVRMEGEASFFHYEKESGDLWMVFNESVTEPIHGNLLVKLGSEDRRVYRYDACERIPSGRNYRCGSISVPLQVIQAVHLRILLGEHCQCGSSPAPRDSLAGQVLNCV